MKVLLTGILVCIIFISFAQGKKKISLKDSTDGKLDLSNYIIDANGFVPVPIIITEPALGGFGGGLAPIFLKKKPPYIDSINGKVKITPVAPDITGGLGLYTVNGTWVLAGFRSGTFIRSRIKYMIGGGLANVNMSFYHIFPQLGERKFDFNFRTAPALLQMTKRISFTNWYVGLKYLFLKTDVNYADSVPSFVKTKEFNSIVSQLGLVIELDNRDNVFTPNDGMKVHVDGIRSDNIFGSDYDFWRINYYTYMYKTISEKLVAGWRLDGQQVFQDPPFYLLPFINMRGVPTARYQGRADILTELEGRWDFISRWSIMFYGGTGKAFDNWNDFGSAKWVTSYGTGFRYLIASKFGVRMGIDIAHGPDTWAYYIVFGSNWLK